MYWILALTLLLLHAALAWMARAPGVVTGHDDATYLILAESLRNLGYHDLFRVDAPVQSQYPPGYPALLAVWGAIFGQRFETFAALGVLLSTASLALVTEGIKRLWSRQVALFCLLPLAVNPFLVQSAGQVMSEAPYMFFSVLALSLLLRAAPPPLVLVLAASVAIMAALTRAAGATVLLAVSLHLLLGRRSRAVLWFSLACAATMGLWLVWSALAPEQYVGESYLADAGFRPRESRGSAASALLGRVARNVPLYFGMHLPQALGVPGIPHTPIDNLFGLLVVLVGLGVGSVVFMRRWRAVALYLLLYLLLLVLWPWALDRFVIPLLPLLLPVVVIGVGTVAGWVRPRYALPVLAVLTLLWTTMGVIRTHRLLAEQSVCERGPVPPLPACVRADQASFLEAVRYIEEHTPPDAVFLNAKPASLFYYTRRRSVAYETARRQPSAAFMDGLRRAGVDYILLGSVHVTEPTVLAGQLRANCEQLEVEAFFPPRSYLFRVAPATGSTREGRACQAVDDYVEANRERDFERDP